MVPEEFDQGTRDCVYIATVPDRLEPASSKVQGRLGIPCHENVVTHLTECLREVHRKLYINVQLLELDSATYSKETHIPSFYQFRLPAPIYASITQVSGP